MKVDIINTQYGDIEVEYSTFTKGFFIKNFPEKLKQIDGLVLLTSRDNSFSEFKKLKEYVNDLVHNAKIDFQFERKVIIYKIITSNYYDGLDFIYMVCDESKKTQRYRGKDNELREYFVHESNIDRYIGNRNIFGQITNSSIDDYVVIDYDENIHQFFKDFTSKFHLLKESLVAFFDKEKVVSNILNSQLNTNLLLNYSNKS